MVKELRLAELLCTRMCHDMAGPIGAVSNGAELLDDEDNESGASQAFELIQMSAKSAVSKLVFFRNAYGRINFAGEADLFEIKGMAENYLEGSKIKLVWNGTHENSAISISRKLSRVILLSILFISEAMIKGGEIEVAITSADGRANVAINGAGPTVKFDANDEKILNGILGLEEIEPKKIPMFLVNKYLAELTASFNLKYTESSISIVIDKTNCTT